MGGDGGPAAPGGPVELGALAERAEELLGGDGGSVMAYEGFLDAVVRWSARDREALARALRPLAERFARPPTRSKAGERLHTVVTAAVQPVGPVEPERGAAAGGDRGWLETCQHEAVRLVLNERIAEIHGRLRGGGIGGGEPMPMLLATPSRAGGAVEPYDLVMRLTEYEQAGVRPGPADLGQALLRCGGGPAEPEVIRAAEQLVLPEAPRVAAWLRRGGLPQPGWTREQEPGPPQRPSRRHGARVGRRVLVGTGALDGRGEFPRRFWPLFRRFEPLIGCNHLLLGHRERHAAAVLPWHPEIVAARLLAEVAAVADRGGPGGPEFLPALAAGEGPPGPAVHLALAYGLGAGDECDREAAVRALLVLAARDRLDGALLGGEIAELVQLGTLKLPVVTGSLMAAADMPDGASGPDGTAAAALWPVLATAVPALLAAVAAGRVARSHPPLLALAARCAGAGGARGPLAEVTALAERPGTSPSVREARRLRDVLAAPP